MKKTIVIDTSILLYDKNSIFNFDENDILIPMIVVEELDRKKASPGLVGENARFINRFLDNLREKGDLSKGVEFKENAYLKITRDYDKDILSELSDGQCNDNKILATVSLAQSDSYYDVVLVTKDINLRIKADVLGFKASDYYADIRDVDKNWIGWRRLEDTSGLINLLYKDSRVDLTEALQNDFYENEFIVLSAGQASALCYFHDKQLHLVYDKDSIKHRTGCTPKNKEQHFALSAMSNDEIPLVTLTGIPGSGKTYLALMTGLNKMTAGEYDRIIYTRPVQSVDKGIGFLPGTMEEKMDPWLAPLSDNFQNAFGDKTYFHTLLDKGKIEVAPISFIRGRSFKNAFIIVDEAQNCTVHELKTIITRVGEGSKIVLCGDTKQIDSPYLDDTSNGLTVITDRFKKSVLSAHIHFTKGYRSALATEADNLIE